MGTKILKSGSPLCSPIYTDDIDVNQLLLNPTFSIPSIEIDKVTTDGNLIAGTYQCFTVFLIVFKNVAIVLYI